MSNYQSSIINLYGYPEKVASDSKTVREIMGRQGHTFLLHCIAEAFGESSLKFSYSEKREGVFN